MTGKTNTTTTMAAAAGGLASPEVLWPRTRRTGLLQWASLGLASAAHAAALGYAIAAGPLSPGAHGRMVEAIGVEIVLNEIVAAREIAADAAAGSPLPLAATDGMANLTAPPPAARPDDRDREGETAAAPPPSDAVAILAAPDAPEAEAARPEPADSLKPRPEPDPRPDAAAEAKPRATTTARLDPEPVPDRRPNPQSKPSSAGGSAAESKRAIASSPARASATPGQVNSYAALVRARIASRKPASAGLRGSPTVTFAISPSGALSYVRIGKSSGHARLDDLALRSVRAAAPFPAPPAAMTGAQLSYRIPFHFE